MFAKSINEWNQDYKLLQLKWRVAKGSVLVLLAGGVLAAAYDVYGNYHHRYLQLGAETVSERVELYQGKSDSWDISHQQKFLYETDFTRSDIEADKRFQLQALADLQQTEISQIQK